MIDFYEVIDDVCGNLYSAIFTVDSVLLSGEDVVPDKHAEDFERAVWHLGVAKEVFDKIYIRLYGEYHGEE